MFDWVIYKLKILKFSETKVVEIIAIVTTRSISCFTIVLYLCIMIFIIMRT